MSGPSVTRSLTTSQEEESGGLSLLTLSDGTKNIHFAQLGLLLFQRIKRLWCNHCHGGLEPQLVFKSYSSSTI